MRSPHGLEALDGGLIFARDWRDPDERTYWRRKSARCAEVLVPERVETRFVVGAYVASEAGGRMARAVTPALGLQVAPDLFFLEAP